MLKKNSKGRCFSQDIAGAICLFVIVVIIVYFMLNHVIERYKQNDPKLYHLRSQLKQLHDIVDELVFLEDKKSYTINKKKIYLCLRDENGDYYHDNMLTFVAIHELAHVLCDEIGHTPKFEKIFNELLDQASSLGLYDPSIAPTSNYCEY